MNALQGWIFLLLLAALAARGLDRLRLHVGDLGFIGGAVGLALVQRILLGQVALDDPWIAPWLLALPVIAARHGTLRDGLAAALGVWMGLTTVVAVLPSEVAGELPQDGLVLAAVFALLLAGAAASVPRSARHLAPLLNLGWMGYFLVRDASLVQSPSIWAVVSLSVAWTGLTTLRLPSRPGLA
jgi:hypothetical protein